MGRKSYMQTLRDDLKVAEDYGMDESIISNLKDRIDKLNRYKHEYYEKHSKATKKYNSKYNLKKCIIKGDI
jgi:hypothetical protein